MMEILIFNTKSSTN